jgi:hypothetical protein
MVLVHRLWLDKFMNYKRGPNRIFYQPTAFQDIDVTIYFYNPALEKTDIYNFTKLEEGLYYLDYDFEEIGEYVGIIFESGVKKKTSVFKVEPGYSLYWINPEGGRQPLM